MIILRPYEPKIYPVVPRSEWREPSLSMPRDMFGNPEWRTRFHVSAEIDGKGVWRGWFDDRDDADAFLWAAVTRTLHIQRALCHLPDPIWSPGWYRDEDIVWQYAVTSYFTSGTSWTVPSDWNNSSNEIIAIGAGGSGVGGYQPEKQAAVYGGGGGGGACSVITNQSYTPSASRTRQVGTGQDTLLKADNNSTNAILAKAGSNASAATGGAGGSSASGTGATKYSGGNGGDGSSNFPGGGGGAAGSSAAGSNGAAGTVGNGGNGGNAGGGATGGAGSSFAAGGNGNAGTELGSGYGSGSGGGGGGNYSAGGGGGNYGGAAAGGGVGAGTGSSAGGLIVATHTPGSAAMKTGFNMPNGW